MNDRTLPRELPREIHRLPESRRQLIFRIRRELAEGVYETPEKLDIALDRMIDRHFADDVVG